MGNEVLVKVVHDETGSMIQKKIHEEITKVEQPKDLMKLKKKTQG